MRLTKLEIAGFKSFLNPLELDFSSGITAVLGPNGCGKTNIVDSIRWVLGEQKTRLLRNTKMENVIFNGTKLRKPLGMAEVHMTLSNDDGTLPLDYKDIRITRRLYRDGVSEYYINGEAARLKDIRGLLVDTGLGSHSYSIIEREMVDSVISDKEQDKRQLLEEAAGIMRYRIQREEALRKIKHTETDLTRLADILVELDKELRSLRYQMGKAKRYEGLKGKVDRMEGALLKRSLFELLEKYDAVKNEREHHQGITLADDNEISVQENQLQESRIRGSESERRLQDLQETRYDIRQSLQEREEKIAILSERISGSRNRIAEDEEEIERATARRTTLAENLSGYQGTLEEKQSELGRLQERLAERERVLESITGELDDFKRKLRDKKQFALDLVREEERERSVREHLHNRLFEIEEKNEKENSQQASLRQREAQLAEKVVREKASLELKQGAVAHTIRALEEAARKSEEIVDLLADCEDEHSAAQIELHKLTEKKAYLERIRSEHSRQEDEVLSGSDAIHGVLADLVHVDKKYRRCFEACLAPVLKGFLANNRESALRCVDAIRSSSKSRYQLLYPCVVHAAPKVQPRGVLGWAIEFANGDDDVMEFLRPYLSDVAVVENLDRAMSVLTDEPHVRVVTLDGVFFDGPGKIFVSGAEEIDMSLLEVGTKLEELSDSIHRAEQAASGLQDRKEMLDAEKTRVMAATMKLREALRRAEGEKDDAAEAHRLLELDLVKIREQLAGLNHAVDENKRSIEAIQARLEEQPRAIEEVVDVDTTDEELERMEARVAELEREKETIGEEAGKVRLQTATIIGEIATAKEKRNNVEMLETELVELIKSRREDARRCAGEIEAAEKDTGECRVEIARYHERIEIVETEIAQVKGVCEDIQGKCRKLEAELKELKTRRDRKKENLQRCDLELATIDTRIAGVIEKARESFGQDLEAYKNDRALFAPREWEEFDHSSLSDLKTKLEAFGPVNMLALEEYNEKKERFDFLSSQKADLDAARESLVQAIRRINREARRRLSETFEQVRENFKSTFTTLFDGGEADLLFVDSDDPLEAKIKIVASPKGKKLHDISSLSGGERALVALSLLFAIYLVKPSPFCVFDEVDAPLDDANIGRFVKMLKLFTDKTQFVVITHNKRTMEAADNLYGITMAEPGVSKIISVHIGEVDKFRDKRSGRPGVPPRESSIEEISVQS